MSATLRPDLQVIVSWIDPNTHMLDLGCGEGKLLAHLRDEKNVSGYGLEIDSDDITCGIEKGLNIIQRDLDEGIINYFQPQSFDYVVMTQAIQALRHPEHMLREMVTIGREAMVTFPNFGHWKNRIQLAIGGYMPENKTLPNPWYNTPNIHLCTIQDFEKLCDDLNIEIVSRCVADSNHHSDMADKIMPNLFGELALYRIKAK